MSFEPDTPLVAELHPSPNEEPRRDGARPDMVLLHYTGMTSAAGAVAWLSRPDSRVSCHYVVDEAGRITQLVAESRRAWHAGVACWAGVTDINSCSIGIEIQNPGHEMGYPAFSDAQLEAVTALTADIARRNAVPPERILAHSDVAPVRKIDPGEKLDWARLARSGVGHWVPPAPLDPFDHGAEPGIDSAAVGEARGLLARYGYAITSEGPADRDLFFVLRAFQLHFRPARIDGRLDASTLETLRRLVGASAVGRIA